MATRWNVTAHTATGALLTLTGEAQDWVPEVAFDSPAAALAYVHSRRTALAYSQRSERWYRRNVHHFRVGERGDSNHREIHPVGVSTHCPSCNGHVTYAA